MLRLWCKPEEIPKRIMFVVGKMALAFTITITTTSGTGFGF